MIQGLRAALAIFWRAFGAIECGLYRALYVECSSVALSGLGVLSFGRVATPWRAIDELIDLWAAPLRGCPWLATYDRTFGAVES